MKTITHFVRACSMKHLIQRTIFFSIFLILISAMPVSGATYYVKNGGNDGLDGLSDVTAWATVAKVQNTAKSGDTVYFRSQDTWAASSGSTVLTATAGVTYNGSAYGSGTRARFVAVGDCANPNYSVVQIYVSNVTFKGFEIDGASHWNGGIYIGAYAPTSISNITVDDCVVHDTGNPTDTIHWAYGILVSSNYGNTTSKVAITNSEIYKTFHEGIAVYAAWGTANNKVDNVLIRNCSIHHTGTVGTGAGCGVEIANDCDNVTVEYCNLYENTGYGIVIRVSPVGEGGTNVISGPNSFIIRYSSVYNNRVYGVMITSPRGFGPTGSFYNNLIFNNGVVNNTNNNGADFFIAGGFDWTNSTFNIYNNTFYSTTKNNSNLYSMVLCGVFGTNTVQPTVNFKNNIVYYNTTASGFYVPIVDQCGGISHSNNLVYRTTSSETHVSTSSKSYDRSGVTTWEPSAKNSDPLFTAAGSNFTLQAASPAIDAGVSVGLTKDLLANPIPIGAAPDIGAFEYQPYPSSTTTTPTTTVTGTTTTTTPTTTVTGTTTTTTTTTLPKRVVRVKKRIFNR